MLQIIAFNSYNNKKWNLYFYRDDKKTEVDLIIETPKKIIAIEIKWSEKFNTKWKESLEFFSEQQLKKPVELVILYRGQRKLKDGLVDIIPFDQFLNELE